MSSRDRILARLRESDPFEDAPPRPVSFLPVTASPEGDLVERFTAELTRLSGKLHVAPDPQSALQTVLGILDSLPLIDQVIAWGALPILDLSESLKAHQIGVTAPNARHASRGASLAVAAQAQVGITGVDAAFATTGTLALVTTSEQGRLPSLLPATHIALLPRQNLYGRLEDWLTVHGRAALMRSNSVVFITGPSRTSDIEMQTILGVHGPAALHVVIFETS